MAQYLGEERAHGQSSGAVLGRVRRRLASLARERGREDLAALFEMPASERVEQGRAADRAIEVLRTLPIPLPVITDDIGRWLPARAVAPLRAHGIDTLATPTVRVPRRRLWWAAIPKLGAASARQIEAFFAAHPELTERARALIVQERRSVVHALARGVESTSVRDNRRHASVSTTSVYLHSDEAKRARQIAEAFGLKGMAARQRRMYDSTLLFLARVPLFRQASRKSLEV